MKRVQLFEFEDFQWFPDWLRSSLTGLIIVLIKMMGLHKIIGKRISQLLQEHKWTDIVDLGSGSGGAMPLVYESIKSDSNMENVRLTLSDLYPSKPTIKRIQALNDPNLTYHETPVNATDFNHMPGGLKTMVNCFHHMRPEQAKSILKSAYEAKQPFMVYEMADNKIPFIAWLIMLPISLVIMMIMVLFMTPFVRPLSWQQILFTYVIPIIPIFYAWDGQASMPRIYTMEDLDVLLEGLSSDEYQWYKEEAKNEKGKTSGYFLIGLPVEKNA